jgi:hypothetical protein
MCDRFPAKSTSNNIRPHMMDSNHGLEYSKSYNSELTKSNVDLDPTRATTYSSKNMIYHNQHALVEKPIRCAQLLCDGCPLRLGGDSGATARALLAVQNDVYTTEVMLQSQKSANSPSPFGAA